MSEETRSRSVVKALSFRVIASLATMGIVLVFTGHFRLAVGIAFVEVICKLILYYGHERLWNMVRWGRLAKHEVSARTEASVSPVPAPAGEASDLS